MEAKCASFDRLSMGLKGENKGTGKQLMPPCTMHLLLLYFVCDTEAHFVSSYRPVGIEG